jgi:hypothetical protein
VLTTAASYAGIGVLGWVGLTVLLFLLWGLRSLYRWHVNVFFVCAGMLILSIVIFLYSSFSLKPLVALVRRPEFRVLGLYVAAQVGLVGLLIWKKDWIISHYGTMLGRIAAVVAIIALLGFCIWETSRFLRWLAYFTRRRPYPPGTFTESGWKLLIGSERPERQEYILSRTTHQSLGLTPTQFLGVLQEVSALIEEEPALSTYWSHRAELEQVLKQERKG